MKHLLYLVSSVLIIIPFLIGVIAGFLWRGFLSGGITGFNVLQSSLENDILKEVESRARSRTISSIGQNLKEVELYDEE